jgi:PTH2 family peptidyl-tRNA hydrolase
MKQVILVRKDLKMSKGKTAAQVSHASVDCLLKSHKDDIAKWKKEGMKKVVLKVEDFEELKKYHRKSLDAGMVTCIISDAGRTELEPGTITCMGIGPDNEEKIDKVTGSLKPL